MGVYTVKLGSFEVPPIATQRPKLSNFCCLLPTDFIHPFSFSLDSTPLHHPFFQYSLSLSLLSRVLRIGRFAFFIFSVILLSFTCLPLDLFFFLIELKQKSDLIFSPSLSFSFSSLKGTLYVNFLSFASIFCRSLVLYLPTNLSR